MPSGGERIDRSIGLSCAPAGMAGLYEAGPVGSVRSSPVGERPARSAAWSPRAGCWVDSMRVGVATGARTGGGSGSDDAHRRVPNFRLDGEDMMQCPALCFRVPRREAYVRARAYVADDDEYVTPGGVSCPCPFPYSWHVGAATCAQVSGFERKTRRRKWVLRVPSSSMDFPHAMSGVLKSNDQ